MKEIFLLSLYQHDLFRYGKGLNKSSAIVYFSLLQREMTVTELVKVTGRSKRTIYRALKKMARIKNSYTSEVVKMVGKKEKKWFAYEVNFDDMAFIVGSSGIGRIQREKYRNQQIANNKLFLKYSKSNKN